MSHAPTGFNQWLSTQLDERRERNPAYSIRAFARFVGVSPATMSLLLRGRVSLSKRTAMKLRERLELTPEEARVLDQSANKLDRRNGGTAAFQLESDRFRLIADWFHFAILSLANLDHNRSSPKWIAKRIGISTRIAASALGRLRRLGLVVVDGRSMRQASEAFTTSHDVPDAAIKRHHRQMLELAGAALTETDVALREFTTITMAINPMRLPEAKQLIRNFRDDLSVLLEAGEKTAVYSLGIQLFPLTKDEVVP